MIARRTHGVVHVAFNRPARKNAVFPEMWTEFTDIIVEIEASASDRAQFSEIFVRPGLTVDTGGSWILPYVEAARRAFLARQHPVDRATTSTASGTFTGEVL